MASNKTVIVTGASQGIGAAVVQAFLGRNITWSQRRAAFPRQASPPHGTSPSSMETSVRRNRRQRRTDRDRRVRFN
jgi:hypothetical protein